MNCCWTAILLCTLPIFFMGLLSTFSNATKCEENSNQQEDDNETVLPNIGTAEDVISSSSSLCKNAVEGNNKQQKRRLKVLVYTPSLGWSHNQFMGKIADTLAEAGHEVHFVKLMLNPSFANRNETSSKVHRVYRVHSKHIPADKAEIAQQMSSNSDSFSGNHFHLLSAMDWNFYQLVNVVAHFCQTLLENDQLLEQLKRERFDVAIAETLDPCPMAMFHHVGAKTTLAASALPVLTPIVSPYGVPSPSSFIPDAFTIPFTPPLQFWQRLVNLCNDIYWRLVRAREFDNAVRPLIESTFGADFPTSHRLRRRMSLLFVNSNAFLEFGRPLSHKVVYIGGLVDAIGSSDAKLEQSLQHILDHSKRGAVLVSFGSVANTSDMGPQMREAMFRAFARFPDWQFIWKFHEEATEEEQTWATNVHTVKWLNQPAILRHPKLRVFITHCGQNSLSEASRAGIPVLGIPLFADQLYNAVLAEHKGMGLHVDVNTLNGPGGEEVLAAQLEKLLTEPNFTQNARLIQRKQALSPFPAADRLVRWVEFAAEFPPLDELNLPDEEELNWFAYFSVDIILLLLAFVALMLFSAGVLAAKMTRWIRMLLAKSTEEMRLKSKQS